MTSEDDMRCADKNRSITLRIYAAARRVPKLFSWSNMFRTSRRPGAWKSLDGYDVEHNIGAEYVSVDDNDSTPKPITDHVKTGDQSPVATFIFHCRTHGTSTRVPIHLDVNGDR